MQVWKTIIVYMRYNLISGTLEPVQESIEKVAFVCVTMLVKFVTKVKRNYTFVIYLQYSSDGRLKAMILDMYARED